MSDADDPTKALIADMARGLGMTYEELTADLESVEYSRAREQLLDAWRRLRPRLAAKGWIDPVKGKGLGDA